MIGIFNFFNLIGIIFYNKNRMTYIYSPWNSSFLLQKIEVNNSQITGTRYHSCFYPGKTELHLMLDNYVIHVKKWLQHNIEYQDLKIINFPFHND